MIDPFQPKSGQDPRLTLDNQERSMADMQGFPVVAGQAMRRDRMGLMLGMSIALLLGAATLYAMSSSRNRTSPASTVPTPAAPAAAMLGPPPTPGIPIAKPALIATAAPAPPATPLTGLRPAPLPPPALLPAAQQNLDLEHAPAVIFDNSPQPTIATPAPDKSARPASQNLTPEEQFAARVTGDSDAVATRMVSPATTIAEGTLMSAVLETALNSDTPGFVRAVISRDVRSYDGSTVLIARGAHVIGEYKSGLAPGQSRAFIEWTRLLRPDGVSIALASPATDYAGENGLTGKVHGHFFKRFGAAILVSLIGSVGEAVGGGGTSVVLAGPQSTLQSGTATNANIPPTVRVPAGTPLRIFTAHDLDFSGVAGGK
ncbi:MAG: TrbI/VirB10 family protein [Alphaproteobacteria bacterium]|nr:TrbI/VirB10 family protein [Alphaproteobacteria bacterium]MDE2041923.1 TrbI/VirB10 family protein [Alphaproteobacteria bacterium]MDE2340406.1 TrbI/VirB10 family protein [Alphaproteobacteria bacterium]